MSFFVPMARHVAPLLLGCIALGCGSGSSSTPRSQQAPGVATKRLVGRAGGSITAGDATLTIPAGALDEDVEVVVSRVTSGPRSAALGVSRRLLSGQAGNDMLVADQGAVTIQASTHLSFVDAAQKPRLTLAVGAATAADPTAVEVLEALDSTSMDPVDGSDPSLALNEFITSGDTITAEVRHPLGQLAEGSITADPPDCSGAGCVISCGGKPFAVCTMKEGSSLICMRATPCGNIEFEQVLTVPADVVHKSHYVYWLECFEKAGFTCGEPAAGAGGASGAGGADPAASSAACPAHRHMACEPAGDLCTDNEECCSAYCNGGLCAEKEGAACLHTGAECVSDEECCSSYCESDGLCAPAGCVMAGEPCSPEAECCTGYACTDGSCALAQ
jgi:hypothetical protein